MTNQEFIESIKLEGEEWKQIDGYGDRYLISSFGRLFRKPIEYLSNNVVRHRPCKFVKPCIHKRKKILYYRVRLQYNGQGKLYYLHRLVATAFLPNPNNYTDVDHIDRNGLNDNVTNLRWCSRKMNMNNENTRIVHVKSLRERKWTRKSLVNQNVKELSTNA